MFLLFNMLSRFVIAFISRSKCLLTLWLPTPVLLPGKSHGRRSLVGFSPWGRYQSDTTEWLHFHFSLSCIGEGNGNPLQCSCLENPRDREAWWSAVYGVAQSRTRLKWLSSSKTWNEKINIIHINSSRLSCDWVSWSKGKYLCIYISWSFNSGW